MLPNNPERFDHCTCVLGKEGFSSGRFYFEVQVKGKTKWDLGVARESINRKGKDTVSPQDGFWVVGLWNENEYWTCTDSYVLLSLRVKPQKVGVFVDYEEGLVSFYDVESRSHIYSFTGQSFTENSILYSALVVMKKVKIQPHWLSLLLIAMNKFTHFHNLEKDEKYRFRGNNVICSFWFFFFFKTAKSEHILKIFFLSLYL